MDRNVSVLLRSHLLIIDLSDYANSENSVQKVISCAMRSRIFPETFSFYWFLVTFSSVGFRAYGFKLRSLSHLELSFVQGDKYVSIWILLHLVQPAPVVEDAVFFFFFQFVFLASLSKIKHVHVWVFDSIPLIDVSVFVPVQWCFYCYSSVVQFEIRGFDTPYSSFIIQNFVVVVCYPRFFCVFIWSWKLSF